MQKRGPVLIVEDDPGQRLDYREFLEDAGFVVADAGDGRKALRRLVDDNEPLPALIVLDLSMPFMDGWDFMANVRDDKRLAAIPVVLTSAYDADADVQGAATAFIKKPVDPQRLVAIVTALLERLT